MKTIIEKSPKRFFNNSKNFNDFTFSKIKHIERFSSFNYDIELFGRRVSPKTMCVKDFQDLLVFAFIKQFVPPGSRILEVGGGNSRIINFFKDKYECWNLDKLEGRGAGPVEINATGFRLVEDYIGNFNPELSNNYFNFVFSISALEHVPTSDVMICGNIFNDLLRVTKPGCYNLHSLDSIIESNKFWNKLLMTYFFKQKNTLNRPATFKSLSREREIFVVSEQVYNNKWRPHTKKTFSQFGKPFAYNVFWKKGK